MSTSIDKDHHSFIAPLNRTLRDSYDFYLSKYDPDLNCCVPIFDPDFTGCKHFLPLPYQNFSRYAKIYRFLTRLKNSESFSFENFTNGILSYIGKKVEFDGFLKYVNGLSPNESSSFNDLIRFLASLTLELTSDNFKRIPLLKSDTCNSLSMSQYQAAILLANGFFCTFDDCIKRRSGDFNTFSFASLFSIQTHKSVEKLKCLFAYFRTIKSNMPSGMITILRQTCPFIRFETINPVLCKVNVEVEGAIEKQVDESHVDFANCLIGGGVLRNGTVQEEIRFIIAPETLISSLLCEKMEKDAILLLGTQQFSNYSGYRNSFVYEPRQSSEETESRTSLGHFPSLIIAIDAICFINPQRQFMRKDIDREIRKAYAGFATKVPNRLNTISTGNWGCGAFNGCPELKFIIQFIAASASGRDLHYFTFGDKKFAERITDFLKHLTENKVSFERLYHLIVRGGSRPNGYFMLEPFKHIIEETAPSFKRSKKDGYE